MNKRIPFGILLSTWMLGLLFVLMLPGSVEAAPLPNGKSQLQAAKVLVSDLGSLPESPSLEFDLKYFLSSALCSEQSLFWKSASAMTWESSYNTLPLFDVKQTFRHFFFTW